MSLEVQYLTVVVRKEALAALEPEVEAAIRQAWGGDEIFREDDHLLATTFMGPQGVAPFVEALEALGLVF